jgi:ribosome-binding factor A
MGRFRKPRVAELLRRVIAEVIHSSVKDPRVQDLTITEVVPSNDLKSARVYFCALADGNRALHQEGLDAAAGFIRRRLRLELDLKHTPTLEFHYDEAFDNFDRINRVIKSLDIHTEADEKGNSPDSA